MPDKELVSMHFVLPDIKQLFNTKMLGVAAKYAEQKHYVPKLVIGMKMILHKTKFLKVIRKY